MADDTVTYVIVVEELPAVEDAKVNFLYVLKTTNELWIVYDGSSVWTPVVSWNVYENSEDAQAASLLYPNKICFVSLLET